ncbi:MAG: hypothetical protein V4439_02455 [Patescibacteria group bacterium]
MSDEFDIENAKARQNRILEDIRNTVRDPLNRDIIDYYWSSPPTSADAEDRNREYMRNRLREIARVIDQIIAGRLSSKDY